MDLSSYWIRFKSFINESIRVLKITRKPNKEEFKTIVKVSGLGMILVGLMGFIITMLKQILFPPRV
jgi:protein transport protein SEC61 subunit gamma-like protein